MKAFWCGNIQPHLHSARLHRIALHFPSACLAQAMTAQLESHKYISIIWCTPTLQHQSNQFLARWIARHSFQPLLNTIHSWNMNSCKRLWSVGKTYCWLMRFFHAAEFWSIIILYLLSTFRAMLCDVFMELSFLFFVASDGCRYCPFSSFLSLFFDRRNIRHHALDVSCRMISCNRVFFIHFFLFSDFRFSNGTARTHEMWCIDCVGRYDIDDNATNEFWIFRRHFFIPFDILINSWQYISVSCHLHRTKFTPNWKSIFSIAGSGGLIRCISCNDIRWR